MLVLSRKRDESIVIDGRITITVVQVNGNSVRLGIEAPREVPVHRAELLRRVVEMTIPAPAAQGETPTFNAAEVGAA